MRTGALHKLKALQVSRLGDGMHSDGGGLFLRVKGGSRSWIFRFTLEGRKKERGLGSVTAVSLAQARDKAAEARIAVGKVSTLPPPKLRLFVQQRPRRHSARRLSGTSSASRPNGPRPNNPASGAIVYATMLRL